MSLWTIYACGVALSGLFFAGGIRKVLTDGSFQLETDQQSMWPFWLGAGVAVLGASFIWPLSIPAVLAAIYWPSREER